ncbi:MAG: alpha/beta fold hydrolase [Verrucomicrobia bacterium]|nr:MAG: alpha/beta fold hydrolase [Verrucomicrobiota bacterium]
MKYLEHQGCQLCYKIVGSGPKIVFIQGTGLHGDGWSPQVESLQNNYTCLTFDNRGMAASQPGSSHLTVEQMADDVLALMDAEGWEAAHLVGHSLGGLIALKLAIAERSRVLSLSLLCTFSRGRDATCMTWKRFGPGLRSYLGTRLMRRRAFAEFVLPPSYSGDRDDWAVKAAALFGHDLADHPPVVMKQMAAMSAYDATPSISKLAGLPTLVVGARHDRIATLEIVRALASCIPDSRLVEFDDAAHGVTITHAAAVNALLVTHFINTPSADSESIKQ